MRDSLSRLPLPALPEATVDEFHRGRFRLMQPARAGHRAGTDAMLLAAAVPDGFSGRLADLGAGAGAAGLAVASRCRGAHVVLVESSAIMAEFARRSLRLPENAFLAERCSVLEADVQLTGRARVAAGLTDRSFDRVIMNPPFNSASDRGSPDPLRRAAHVMPAGQVETWIRTAAAILRPGGGLAVIVRPAILPELLAALGMRFGAVRLLPIHSRKGGEAVRILLSATSGSRKPLAILPAICMHADTGNGFTAEAQALINGQAVLPGL